MLMRTDPFRDLDRLTQQIRAPRPALNGEGELNAAERPRGAFSRQLILGDNLDNENVGAAYSSGVLTVRIPVAQQAKPRKIQISSEDGDRQAINA